MNTDLPLRVLAVFAAAFFAFAATAAALTIDLGKTREGEPISIRHIAHRREQDRASGNHNKRLQLKRVD